MVRAFPQTGFFFLVILLCFLLLLFALLLLILFKLTPSFEIFHFCDFSSKNKWQCELFFVEYC